MLIKISQLVFHFLSSAWIYSALFMSLRPRIDKYRDNQREITFPPQAVSFHDSKYAHIWLKEDASQ